MGPIGEGLERGATPFAGNAISKREYVAPLELFGCDGRFYKYFAPMELREARNDWECECGARIEREGRRQDAKRRAAFQISDSRFQRSFLWFLILTQLSWILAAWKTRKRRLKIGGGKSGFRGTVTPPGRAVSEFRMEHAEPVGIVAA
jgi:hypothetical protein